MKLDSLAKAHVLAEELKDIQESQARVKSSNQPIYYLSAPVSGPTKNVMCAVTRNEMADFLAECANRRVVSLRAIGVEA